MSIQVVERSVYTYTDIFKILLKLATVQLTSAGTSWPMAASSMPIERVLALFWFMLDLGSKPNYWWRCNSSTCLSLYLYVANMAATTPTMVGLLPHIAAEILVGKWQMRVRIDTFDPLTNSSAPLSGHTSLHHDNNVGN